MEVCVEAKRVMVQALSKMYSSRNQRGGIPLHRSLLLTLVMRAARDAYHSARGPDRGPDPSAQGERSAQADRSAEGNRSAQGERSAQADSHTHEELMDTAEAPEPPCALQSGERTLKQHRTADKENCNTTGHHAQSRKRRGKSGSEPDFLPCKKARLDPAELRRVLHDSTARSLSGNCARETDPLSATHMPRTIATC
ncbi:immediate early response gene 2 protein [Pangasianodon hypophthalmus]|uniref:immediate early response gene 2 protein n=1 Tax=Pangasianodon hypophthalmus TaxID=310915 RepID=UPI000EFEA3ED|nr:immediate early response gene 2 protein [Pangasianodon hypophthalmus]